MQNDISANRFSQYSNTYTVSNEDIVTETKLCSPQDARVLTVAASGDQPMFYAIAGASHIDTFDISFMSRVIMDFKTTALQTMTWSKYCQQLTSMPNLTAASQQKKFAQVVERMPATTRDVMTNLVQHRPMVFSYSLHIEKRDLPTRGEYALMQKTITQPFNFIWTDLASLHTCIDSQYDIINLSNIADHITPANLARDIQNLIPYLTPNGRILIATIFNDAAKISKTLARLITDPNLQLYIPRTQSVFDILIIQKSR